MRGEWELVQSVMECGLDREGKWEDEELSKDVYVLCCVVV